MRASVACTPTPAPSSALKLTVTPVFDQPAGTPFAVVVGGVASSPVPVLNALTHTFMGVGFDGAPTSVQFVPLLPAKLCPLVLVAALEYPVWAYSMAIGQLYPGVTRCRMTEKDCPSVTARGAVRAIV